MKIVFFGDSITDCGRDRSDNASLGNGYVGILYEKLKNLYEDRTFEFLNRGIGGDVTDGLLRRMDESIFALEPKKVFINIGTNDISSPGYTRERLLAQYRKILEQIKARLPETEIYVLSYYPVNRALPGVDPEQVAAMFGARTNEELRAVNGELEALAAALGCTYIDVFDCLTDENGNLRAEYTIEGMHMYANGYAVVLERLLPYLLENI